MPATINPRARADTHTSSTQFRVPVLLLGIGLGSFVDGILLHQILQWHHMISDTADGSMTTLGGLQNNTFADGLFHAVAFVVVIVALWLGIRTKRAEPRALLPTWGIIVGWLLVGWGAFNIVEGLIDHHLLTVHHVRDDVADPLAWDVAFLAVSAVLVLSGWMLVRRGDAAERRSVPHY